MSAKNDEKMPENFADKKSDKSLREMLDDFEQIVSWFSDDELDVEIAVKKFEEGSKLADNIREKLEKEKNKIEIIKRQFDANISRENDAQNIIESANNQ